MYWKQAELCRFFLQVTSTAKDKNMYRMQKTKHWYSETLLRKQANAPISIQKFADVKKPDDSIESGFWS